MKITKTHIYIAIAVLVLLVALGIYFYKQGKKQVTLQSAPGDLPGNSGGTAGASNDEIKNVAIGLHDEMNGPNFLGHKMEFYKRALLFSDTDIVKLYNAFNAMYQGSSGETLTQWLDGELFSSNLENEGNLLEMRLKKLNCV